DENSSITIELLSPRFHSTAYDVKSLSSGDSLKDQVEELEKNLIIQTLQETKGNILRAAKKLKLSRPGLHKKLTRYKIDPKPM
ncbi:MAG: sigma-54-dependent Fis family transcriptional regulator, partial [Calditrichia bacterium]|nr:sigma-54-dependent Fis family transcriptional regulator [Calditrichia bacterium]